MAATLILTAYRIKIERDQIKVIKRNAEAMRKLETVKDAIEREKDMIMELKNGEEFYDMLKCLFGDT